MATVKEVVLGVTGSISAYKAADIIRRLQEHNIKVSVIMTAEAEKFITSLTLASLIGEKVHRGMFEEQGKDWNIDHVQLAKRASLVLIAPATANIIGKIANGIADDLLTCTVMATEAPILIAPAMNEGMYKNKIFQENCNKLKNFGIKMVSPTRGKLACGTIGVGHLADVETIVKYVIKNL